MAGMQTSLPPDLPEPPMEYDQAYMRQLVALIAQALYAMSQRRPIVGSSISLTRLPTSATGLRVGDVWIDVDTLKIVV